MLIAIDARILETSHRFRGIGIYAKNLIQGISEIDHTNQYIFLTQSNNSPVKKIIKNKKFPYQTIQVRKTNEPEKYNWYLDQIYLPKIIKKQKVDLVHFLDQLSSPLIKTTKTIVTIHDLMQISQGYISLKNKIKLLGAKHANKIITISNSSKKDIPAGLKISPDKIKVIYPGYDKKIFQPAKNTPKLDTPYFFYAGSFEKHEPRKNIDFLIEMFVRFSEISDQKNIVLVLAGKEGKESQRIKTILKQRGISDKVVFTGFIDLAKLVLLLQGAEALLFPSLYEGFGLPPLEAMACGTPVICSNRSSLPEVMSGAGILIDPEKIPIWIDSMNKILRSDSYKNKLIERGLEQAKKFSWEKCAKETIKTYKEVCDGKN